MTKLFRTAGLLLLAAAIAAPVMAQTLTGLISGTIKDEQGAVLPGVTVTLTGKQGTQTQVTEANGNYRFPALEVGTYEVSAELSGFAKSTQGNLQISPGRELTIDLQMKVAGLAENVTVVGDTPVVDVKSSATETTISQSLLASAPITRTAINVINYAPGVNNSSAYGGGADSGNSLLIDGVDTRDPEGAPPGRSTTTTWSRSTSSRASARPRSTAATPARWSTRSPSRAATASRGLFDYFGTSKGLGSNNISATIAAQNPSLADPATTKKYADITTQFGGPIKQNKLFFFVSAQRFLLETDPSGPVTTRHEVSPRLNGKITWQMNANNQFTGHLQFDAYNITGRAGVPALDDNDA